jgi:hypothetical protein
MKKMVLTGLLGLGLAACGDGNPFTATDTGTGTGGGTGGGAITNPDRVIPPGTPSPSNATGIFRSEPTSTDDATDGNGFATGISYDAGSDTFTVDNLAFDGDNGYARGAAVSSLGAYAVYEADDQYPDSLTGAPINQLSHRAIYGVSASGETQFAIVRTGAYRQYGFGGFIYQRDGDVTLPNTGQALYNGRTAGVRDFNGRGGSEFSTADLAVAIDFDDFNDSTGTRGDAVRGFLDNRQVFDINGNDITANIVSNINNASNASLSQIPALTFVIQPGVLDDNGEIIGTITSSFVDNTGSVQTYESGNYYAILSGDNAQELVGIIVAENASELDGVTVRDTSGFILLR